MTLRALGIAAGGGSALLRRIEIISQNLANAQTPGARRIGVDSLQPGKLQSTQRDLDLAIDGDAYFRVQTTDGGVAFTRGGNLRRDAEGYIVTAGGLQLDPPLQVPSQITKLTIGEDGFVEGQDPAVPEAPMPLGQIELTRFTNPAGLQQIGPALFLATDAAGDRIDGRPEEGLGAILQGQLELPDIDPMRELAELAQVRRVFELNNKVIQTADEVLQGVNQLRRKM
jgi:flagellar basal-body rod protein FlgG